MLNYICKSGIINSAGALPKNAIWERKSIWKKIKLIHWEQSRLEGF